MAFQTDKQRGRLASPDQRARHTIRSGSYSGQGDPQILANRRRQHCLHNVRLHDGSPDVCHWTLFLLFALTHLHNHPRNEQVRELDRVNPTLPITCRYAFTLDEQIVAQHRDRATWKPCAILGFVYACSIIKPPRHITLNHDYVDSPGHSNARSVTRHMSVHEATAIDAP